MSKKDTLYKKTRASFKPFKFNQEVVDVFPDMIQRSVPGYPLTITMIAVLAKHYAHAKTSIYDLGCSLGAVSFAVQQAIQYSGCRIIAVDNSKAMIDACKKLLKKQDESGSIDFIHADINDVSINNASIVIMNFTLQFIPLEKRLALLKNIYKGILPGGVFIISEKIVFEGDVENHSMEQLHLQMKSMNDYDAMEIAGKRQALDKVLIPETIEIHTRRLEQAGFKNVFVWFRCFNFVSIIAVK